VTDHSRALAMSPRQARWLGRVLVAQGAVGLALLLPTMAIIWSVLIGQVGQAGVASSVDRALQRAQVSIADGARATRTADDALASTGASTAEASSMLSELAAAMREGSASLRINLFGQQPFVPLADSFARTAERADLAARSIGRTGPQVELTRRSMADLSADLDSLAVELGKLRAAAPSEAPVIALGILLVSVVGWLAVAAAICLALGWRLLRPSSGLPKPGRRTSGGTRRPSEGPSGGRRDRGSDQQATSGTTG
jgi:hypothetical protein